MAKKLPRWVKEGVRVRLIRDWVGVIHGPKSGYVLKGLRVTQQVVDSVHRGWFVTDLGETINAKDRYYRDAASAKHGFQRFVQKVIRERTAEHAKEMKALRKLLG